MENGAGGGIARDASVFGEVHEASEVPVGRIQKDAARDVWIKGGDVVARVVLDNNVGWGGPEFQQRGQKSVAVDHILRMRRVCMPPEQARADGDEGNRGVRGIVGESARRVL